MAVHHVVAVLGRGVVPADTPILRADDLGVLRGDGIFETLHVRQGRPWLLDEHLRRMARSAERLELPLPARPELEALVAETAAGWPPSVEGALRLVCTRGLEGGDGAPTVFATLGPVGAGQRRARVDGIDVVTASIGVTAEGRPAAPWLLAGAKTLSYAVNMASLRYAGTRAVDDTLWVSSDGYALEAPTSTLVWLEDDTLYTVPAAATGILAGTTARWLLDHAGELGWRCDERLIRPAELAATGGAWLASSVRGLAEIRTLDGVDFGLSPETGRILKLLGFPTD